MSTHRVAWTGLLLACVAVSTASGLRAGEPGAAEARATARIAWKLPHQFEEAVAEAKARNRILLIKGVSFGIDAAGARCATKGKW